ncbi:hypothetical protein Y032_0333g2813 [Ancylostoma ceylanicum]|nr:hypothetical protein Y032_0333g2813 [Ancylostoma ceylanicum]
MGDPRHRKFVMKEVFMFAYWHGHGRGGGRHTQERDDRIRWTRYTAGERRKICPLEFFFDGGMKLFFLNSFAQNEQDECPAYSAGNKSIKM